ncbi:MAG: hypothetical protein IJW24_04525 [Clostridia bacterium]|nr:hypothetical protein [Clostridia bacterium]
MRQSHYICEDPLYAEKELFPLIVELFVKTKFRATEERLVQENTTFYDSYGLKLLKKGGHCKVTASTDKKTCSENVIVELRHGKKNSTKRFTAQSLDFTAEELSKVFGFNNDLIPIVKSQADISHIFMEYTTPDAWFGDLKPHFDFVSSQITAKNCKYETSGKAFMFSLIDRTGLLYNNYIASSFSSDVEHCFDVFDAFMKSKKIKKIPSHTYSELLNLSQSSSANTKTDESDESEA